MSIRGLILGLLALVLGSTACAATVVIAHDEGGRIGTYIDRFKQIRASSDNVVIDGDCMSACTLVVGLIPRERLCFTERGRLGFHAAWKPGFLGMRVLNQEGTQTMWAIYPAGIRAWIARKGGLSDRVVYLEGAELSALYPRCSQGLTARARAQ
jgi:hypothetical protein